jgi:hypothetical protein
MTIIKLLDGIDIQYGPEKKRIKQRHIPWI